MPSLEDYKHVERLKMRKKGLKGPYKKSIYECNASNNRKIEKVSPAGN